MEQLKPRSATEHPLDYNSVCQDIRAAFDTVRIQAISLHDEGGNLLWMTESSMGPDEHNAVRDAIESFSSPDSRPVTSSDLGDFRSAVLFRATNARRATVGAVMVVVDSRSIRNDGTGLAMLMTPKLQSALHEFADMRPAAKETAPANPAQATAAQAAEAPFELTLADSMRTRKPTPPLAASAQPTLARSAASGPPGAGTTAAREPIAKPVGGASTSASAPRKTAVTNAAPQPATPFELTLADSMRIRKPAPPPNAVHNASRARASAPVQSAAQRQPSTSPQAPQSAAQRPASTAPQAPQSAAAGRAAVSAPPPPYSGTARSAVDSGLHPLPTTAEATRLHARLRRSPIALSVQRLMPLAKGTELNRYEVLLRTSPNDSPNAAPTEMLKAAVDNGLGSMIDRRVLTELTSWLARHPIVWKSQENMFSVNLTSTALRDEHFIRFVGLCLARSSLPAAMIAFEIDVATAMTLGAEAAQVAAALHGLGCPLVLDDFGMRTECFDLLRLPGVRYVKLAPDITKTMRTDKMSQAAITAVVQMARVLGMHTVAKHTETAADHEWLTALGVDFVQSNALSPAVPINSLVKTTPPMS